MEQRDDIQNWSVRAVHRKFQTSVLRTAQQAVRAELALWGEVLDVVRGHSARFLTLLDGQEDALAIAARLPLEGPPIRVGDMIGIEGHLDARQVDNEPGLIVSFIGTRIIHNRGPSARVAQRQELLRKVGGYHRTTLHVSPARISVVTSRTSRALDDFYTAIGDRVATAIEFSLLHVELDDAASVADGILRAADRKPDLVVLTRGGGSSASLQPFNSEAVVSAIATTAQDVPVLVAIGHAGDATAAAAVASYVAPTPTAAGHQVRYLYNQLLIRERPPVPVSRATAVPPARRPLRMRALALGASAARLVGSALLKLIVALWKGLMTPPRPQNQTRKWRPGRRGRRR